MSRRLVPLEDFFRKPEVVRLRLSPDGGRLAYLKPWKRRLNVFVRAAEGGEETRLTSAEERDVGGFIWVDDGRIVYAQDKGGDENDRLFAVDVDGRNVRDLTPFDDVKCGIVDDLEEVEGEILFRMNQRDKRVFDVYRLDTRTGNMRLVAENPGNVQSWITDHAGALRLATTTDGVNTSILYRETEVDSFRVVATYNFKESASPLFFTFDNERLYVSSNVGRDKAAIFEYDPRTGKEADLVFEHGEVDVDSLLASRHRKRITGVAFETDRLGYRFFDEARARIQDVLDERFAGYDNRVVSHAKDESRFVIHSGSDRTRGSFHLLDAESLALAPLFELSPWLDESEMAEMRPIRYTARDGLEIRGYITLPPEVEPRDLPLVVHPHGGPWARDSFGFNPEVQFLANRGYAVLQMNFRGSTGFGRRFMEASFGQWGRSMQDDVSDGVRFAVEEGFADPKRVAIYGASYGGYATLAGVTQTPELYACAVSYVGVSNLFTWIASIPPYWTQYLEMIHEMVGHPERDRERFEAHSPLFNVGRIRCPLLVAQGANDPRVRKEESDQIVAALRARGIECEYVLKENEGHGFSNEENQFEFYRRMEEFLDRHVGAAH